MEAVREDSLIKSFKIEPSEIKTYKQHKITFITVKNMHLVYFTNNNDFIESLNKFKDGNFVIYYEFSKTHDLVDESEGIRRIIKVKLPKLPKK